MPPNRHHNTAKFGVKRFSGNILERRLYFTGGKKGIMCKISRKTKSPRRSGCDTHYRRLLRQEFARGTIHCITSTKLCNLLHY
jgi:hypothetical protein